MASQLDSVDLSLVSTDDLMTELLSRADHGVVALYHVLTDNDDYGECRMLRRWKGNSLVCAGLATAVSVAALQGYDSSAADGEPPGF